MSKKQSNISKVLPAVSELLPSSSSQKEKSDTSAIETYKAKLLSDLAQALRDKAGSPEGLLVFNLGKHIEEHTAQIKIFCPSPLGWTGTLEDHLSDFLATELDKEEGYSIFFSAMALHQPEKLVLITWGWIEY